MEKRCTVHFTLLYFYIFGVDFDFSVYFLDMIPVFTF